MNQEEKKRIASFAQKLIDDQITFDQFQERIPTDLEDEDVSSLLDLIEHEPSEKTIFGRDNKKFHDEHVKMIKELINKILAQ